MVRLISMVLVLGMGAAVCPARGQDTTYRDPRHPSYTLLVPDGWTATTTEQGVKLSYRTGYAFAQLGVQQGSLVPSDSIASMTKQIGSQWKNFRVLKSDECRFGGLRGAYAVFSGVAPNGKSAILKVVATTNGKMAYILALEASSEQYPELQGDLDRIQDSFSPELIESGTNEKEKLDALYNAGVLSKEEYEAKKRQLGGNENSTPTPSISTAPSETTYRDRRHPSYTLAVPAGWTATENDQGVKLVRSSGLAQLWVRPEVYDPVGEVASFRSQLEKQWKQFRQVDRGECRFGGEKAAFAVYTGVGTSGEAQIMKVVIMNNGKLTYTLITWVHRDEYNDLRKDMERIQQSFTPEIVAVEAPPRPAFRADQLVGNWRARVTYPGHQLEETVEIFPDYSFRATFEGEATAVGRWQYNAAEDSLEVKNGTELMNNAIKFTCTWKSSSEGHDSFTGTCLDRTRDSWNVVLTRGGGSLPEVPSKVPRLDISSLTMAEKAVFVQALATGRCTCPCGLTVLMCLEKDQTCPYSPTLASNALAAFLRMTRD